MRRTKRGKQAVEDAVLTMDYLAKIYSEPFGMTISKENTPEIWALLDRVLIKAHECSEKAKSRVIVGFHFQSDVDAARIITPTMIARLHADEEFAKQLQKAKKEFQSKK